MTQGELQELNEELARWAGFKKCRHFPMSRDDAPQLYRDVYGKTYRKLPNFITSLDACFKWLVPITIDKIMSDQGCSSDVAYAILFKKWLQELELIIPEAALALCLAIKKMILTKGE